MKKYKQFKTLIVIPTFNGWDLLKDCLASLQKQTNQDFKILIIDDGSQDKTKEKTKKYFPKADLIFLKNNSGFVKAINTGIKYGLTKYQPQYLVFLNNDTQADKNWLKSLIDRAKSKEEIIAVTSNMFFLDNPEIINSQGGIIDWNGDGYDINIFKNKKKTKTKSQPVLGACFGGTLVKAEKIKKVGLLDHRFHAYYEDLDWSWRANILGYQIYFEKEAILYHHGSASYQNNLLKKTYLCKRNALASALKNYQLKNLFKKIVHILIGYWFLVLDYSFLKKKKEINKKNNLTFIQRIKFIFIPFRAIVWNFFHLPLTLIYRRKIQKNRQKSDQEIFNLIKQDQTPVQNWINSLKRKFSFLKKKEKFGVNLLGYLDAQSGVGEAGRSIARAIQKTNIPLALNNEASSPSQRTKNEFSNRFTKKNPYSINLITIYGDTFKQVVEKRNNYLKGKYNIAYWAWELSQFPKKWVKLLEFVDEVWVPSKFVQKAIQEKTSKPVKIVPHPIKTEKAKLDRKYFSLPEKSFIFLFVFDFYSWFERKNPLAIIKSFKKVLANNSSTHLVIKCSNADVDPNNFEKLKKEASGLPITIINRYLSSKEIKSLLNICDCYISLHRSEGFGLTMAEAMALGKPVIATAYSGNLDFMNNQNSFLVNYQLKEIAQDFGPYKKGNFWAEPDINQASQKMKFVLENKKQAQEIGLKAKEYINNNLSPEKISEKVKKRILEIKNLGIDK